MKLQAPPTEREVYRFEDVASEYAVYSCYTINEAAVALGKTQSTLKRWIAEGFVPKPILKDSTHGYMQYTLEELQMIHELILELMQNRAYIANSDRERAETIMQRIEGYRRSSV